MKVGNNSDLPDFKLAKATIHGFYPENSRESLFNNVRFLPKSDQENYIDDNNRDLLESPMSPQVVLDGIYDDVDIDSNVQPPDIYFDQVKPYVHTQDNILNPTPSSFCGSFDINLSHLSPEPSKLGNKS